MTHRIRAWLMITCCCILLAGQSEAQKSSVNKAAPSIRTAPKNAHTEGLDQVFSMVHALVIDSERYQDQALRARIQAQAADILWNTDEVFAKELFVRAWTLAEKVDIESEQAAAELEKKALSSGGRNPTIIAPAANVRSEVLRLAARHGAVAEEFLNRMTEAAEQADQGLLPKNRAPVFFDPTEPKLVVAKRLEVALQLLESGDVNTAKAFAEPGLDYVTSQGIIFVSSLRERDRQGADALYAKLLARTRGDMRAEATTVSLLSSYIFTPNLLVTATTRGRVSNQFAEAPTSYDVSPALRASFLNVAASILLKPPPAREHDLTSAGRAGTYFTIARLLPLFQQYANSYVPALKNQLVLLAPDAPETYRNGEEQMLKLGLAPKKKAVAQDIIEQLDSSATSTERDILYVKAIREGAPNGDARIREFASRIEEVGLRDSARAFADLALVRNAIKKRDVDGTLSTVRDGYLSPLHRVWALASVGRIVKKSDPGYASQLLHEAATEANRITMGEPDRVYASVCVAFPLLEFDRDRLWDFGSEVVKAANATRGFSGENGNLSSRLRASNIVAMLNWEEPTFSIGNLFDLLSNSDLQLAISLANTFRAEAPRAVAMLAIARSVLNKRDRSPVASRR